MTALNFINRGDRAYFYTDAASIDADGKVTELKRKGIPTTTFPGFLFWTGPANWGPMFELMMTRCYQSIDELAELGRERFLSDIRHWIADQNSEEVYFVVVAGWSSERGCVRTVSFWASGDSGFRVDDVWSVSPWPDDSFTRAFIAAGKSDRFEPEAHGLWLIELQRMRRMRAGNTNEGCHFIGGFANLTEISEDGITHRIIRGWDEDSVGEIIAPVPLGQPPVFPSICGEVATNVVPMQASKLSAGSRALRRAEEKRVRKAAKLNRIPA